MNLKSSIIFSLYKEPSMDFCVANALTNSLAKLTGEKWKSAKITDKIKI